MSLAVVRDLREARVPAGPDELAAFETDMLAGFVLARAAAGLADNTIRSDVLHLEQCGPGSAAVVGHASRGRGLLFRQGAAGCAKGTRLARSQALKTYFLFLELRHKAEIHQLTGRVVECPIDEINRPGGGPGGAADPAAAEQMHGCSPGGAGSWRPAASSRLPPATTLRPG